MHHRSPGAARAAHRSIAAGLSSLAMAALFSGVARPAAAQVPGAPAAAEKEAELPHPFFTHMGLPESVGMFNLRTLGLVTRADGGTDVAIRRVREQRRDERLRADHRV